MGTTSYSFSSRSFREEELGYKTKGINDIFTQNQKQEIHESMDPKNAHLREARDSAAHPNTIPIELAMDVTGSMGMIPHYLVKDGLPHMMNNLISQGVADPALLFLAIGDHEMDRYPLQVGQFESGDQELDMWLTRTFIERGGGGNAGESYLLAWYFAAMHTVTDAWEKRHQKGFIFTIGDEPCLSRLPSSSIRHIMGGNIMATDYTDKDLLKLAQEKWEVYHLHIMQGQAGRRSLSYWQDLLGQNCLVVNDYEKVSDVLASVVVKNSGVAPSITSVNTGAPANPTTGGGTDPQIIL